MPTLMLHAVIALLRLLLHGGRPTLSLRKVVREIAYVRAQMLWLQLCIEPVEEVEPSLQSRTTASPYLPPMSHRSGKEERA